MYNVFDQAAYPKPAKTSWERFLWAVDDCIGNIYIGYKKWFIKVFYETYFRLNIHGIMHDWYFFLYYKCYNSK